MDITWETMELPEMRTTHGKFFCAKGKTKAIGTMIDESLSIHDGRTRTNSRNHNAIMHAI
jgi:hypothetical protein